MTNQCDLFSVGKMCLMVCRVTAKACGIMTHEAYNKLCMVLQPLRWRCVDCVIHHERDVREE